MLEVDSDEPMLNVESPLKLDGLERDAVLNVESPLELDVLDVDGDEELLTAETAPESKVLE